MMIIQIPRDREDGTKIETQITCPTGTIQIKENGEKQMYNICGVITHKGTLTDHGHYTYSYYDRKDNIWKTIDDNTITIENNVENMTGGTIYVLLKEKYRRNESSISRDNTGRENYRGKITYYNRQKDTNSGHTPLSSIIHQSSKDHNSRGVVLYGDKLNYSCNQQGNLDKINRQDFNLNCWKKPEIHNFEKPYDGSEYPPLEKLMDRSDINNSHKQYMDGSVEEGSVEEVSWNPQLSRTFSNRRYYKDRDEPEGKHQGICWWHKSGKCKFGEDCYYQQEDRNLDPKENAVSQPFRKEAQ
jgi:hypothetical protein